MKIKHNRYNDAGEVVDTFYVEYPDNEKDDRIILTDDFIKSIGRKMKMNESFASNYAGYEKPVYHHDKKVKSMIGEKCEITILYENGKTFVIKFGGAK